MEYFTKQMWGDLQDTRIADTHKRWDDAFKRYAANLESLRGRLPNSEFTFFAEAEVHDGEVLSLLIKDGSRPAPLDQPPRSWNCESEFPVTFQIIVLDAYDQTVWQLDYARVRKLAVDYPSDEVLMMLGSGGFGDWGYHELRDAGDSFLAHEILFRSGSTILVEFMDVIVKQYSRAEFARTKSSADLVLSQKQ